MKGINQGIKGRKLLHLFHLGNQIFDFIPFIPFIPVKRKAFDFLYELHVFA